MGIHSIPDYHAANGITNSLPETTEKIERNRRDGNILRRHPGLDCEDKSGKQQAKVYPTNQYEESLARNMVSGLSK